MGVFMGGQKFDDEPTAEDLPAHFYAPGSQMNWPAQNAQRTYECDDNRPTDRGYNVITASALVFVVVSSFWYLFRTDWLFSLMTFSGATAISSFWLHLEIRWM